MIFFLVELFHLDLQTIYCHFLFNISLIYRSNSQNYPRTTIQPFPFENMIYAISLKWYLKNNCKIEFQAALIDAFKERPIQWVKQHL